MGFSETKENGYSKYIFDILYVEESFLLSQQNYIES